LNRNNKEGNNIDAIILWNSFHFLAMTSISKARKEIASLQAQNNQSSECWLSIWGLNRGFFFMYITKQEEKVSIGFDEKPSNGEIRTQISHSAQSS
jgi:hypothetical protein